MPDGIRRHMLLDLPTSTTESSGPPSPRMAPESFSLNEIRFEDGRHSSSKNTVDVEPSTRVKDTSSVLCPLSYGAASRCRFSSARPYLNEWSGVLSPCVGSRAPPP